MRTLLIALLIALPGLGCKKQSARTGHSHAHGSPTHSHGENDDHAHEHKIAQITVQPSGYEIFAEHTPPAAGQPARFVAHVSDTNSGQPRSEGMVKFVLRKGGEQFEHPQARPERPGIYISAITFPSAGEWNMSVVIPSQTNAVIE